MKKDAITGEKYHTVWDYIRIGILIVAIIVFAYYVIMKNVSG